MPDQPKAVRQETVETHSPKPEQAPGLSINNLGIKLSDIQNLAQIQPTGDKKPGALPPVELADKESLARGKALFRSNDWSCISCHDSGNNRKLLENSTKDFDMIIRQIKKGTPIPEKTGPQKEDDDDDDGRPRPPGKPTMPGFGDDFGTKQEFKDIAAYVRSLQKHAPVVEKKK